MTWAQGWLYKRGAALIAGGNPGYKKRWFGELIFFLPAMGVI
jgi:hypothetical protein